MNTQTNTSKMSENSQKSKNLATKTKKALSKLCCCHETYELEVIPMSTTYFKRYDPRNISIRNSVRKSLKKFDQKEKKVTGMAKFVKSKDQIETLRKNEENQVKKNEEAEAERIVKSILDGQRPGTLKYKIDRSQSQPVLRVKNYFVYDL